MSEQTTNRAPSLMDHPPYRAAAENLNRLRERLNGVNERVNRHYADAGAQRPRTISDEAAELVTGLAPAAAVAAPPPAGEIDALLREQETLQRAVRMQEHALTQLRSEAAGPVCKPLVPEYRRIVQSVADAARALGEACAAEFAFRDRLERADVPFTGVIPPACLPRGVADLNDPYSELSRFLKQARDLGYLEEKGRRDGR